MSEPQERDGEFGKPASETLATATLADAGQAARQPQARTAEPRAFGDDAARTESEEGPAPIFPSDEADDLRASWDSIQASFVDEPRQAVEKADQLVAEAMQRLAETFARERADLEAQWDRGDDVSTEDLRVALRRYRAFFGRLLAA